MASRRRYRRQRESRNRTGMPDTAPEPRRRRNLAEQIARSLRERLTSGELRTGDQLPTEKELSQAHGVSRAVVREAIAALRSEGLVNARQGAGLFVAERSETMPGTLSLSEPEKLSSIIEVLELRAAVEAEAAALAAERRSPAEMAKIGECHAAVGEAVEAGDQAEDQDFAFHLAIATATHNRHFVEFFRFLGARTIPRAQARLSDAGDGATARFLHRIHQEHTDIVQAIADQDAGRARHAMAAHLKGSQQRYEHLAGARFGGERP